ncbi:MAG: hypothetical protein R8K50_04425 [Mariprofundus sp.]
MANQTVSILMALSGVIIMAAFMPLTAYSFFTSRLKRKKEEYRDMLEHLGYSDDMGPAYVPSLEDEYKPGDYFLPVVFATIITALCAAVLIFGGQLADHPEISLIINGPSIAGLALEATVINKLFGMLIIGLAFMGSYIWSIQSLFRRLSTVDLTPAAYYAVGIRIIFSVFVGLLIYYLFAGGDITSVANKNNLYDSPSGLALYAFFAGMFPQRALQYIQDKIQFSNTNDHLMADPLPLQMIEGIDLFERTRFVEVGIDNAQNLAKSNFIELIIKTPFNPREIIDWIGQARLYLYFKDDIIHLRKAGVRTIFNLYALGKDEGNLETIAQLVKEVPLEKLKIVYAIIEHDADIKELKRALELLIISRNAVSSIPVA